MLCHFLKSTFLLACLDNERSDGFAPNKHVAALVLARGGSTGVLFKNVKKIGENTLLGISLDVLKNASGFNSIWVSTDHDVIYRVAEKHAVNIHWRSPDTATNEATSLFAVQEFMKNHKYIDVLALVQCTSPFIKPHHIEEASKLIKEHECVFSVTRSFSLRWKKENKRIVPVNFNPKDRPRRQDFSGELIENGMFYFAERTLIEKGMLQSNRCAVVEISKYEDLEIDTYLDLTIAKLLWNVLK